MAEEKAKKQVNPAFIQAVKAIAVLVVICLVCVLLLALCNDLLYIDDDTRLERAMQKVYKDFEFDEELTVQAMPDAPSYGTINRVLRSKDGAYVIEALGTGGYQNGSVTLYVVVSADGVVKGWAVKENDKQSYIDRIPSNAGTTWYVGKELSKELELEMTGATVKATSTAIRNAINIVGYYCREVLVLTQDPEEAAVRNLLGEDYADYKFNRVALGSATIDGKTKAVDALSDDDNTLVTLFAGLGNKGTIFAYVYGEGDAAKIVVVADDSILTKTENVTGDETFVANILAYPFATFTYGGYNAYAVILNNDTSVYTVAGLGIDTQPTTYILVITIKTEGNVGVVEDIEFYKEGDTTIGNGWAPGVSETSANILIEKLIGATSATIEQLYNDNKVSGATESANLIRVAVEAALKHYDASLASNG